MAAEVHIGNPRGRIAIWCDESEAIDLAHMYGVRDLFYRDIMNAIEEAYPKQPEGGETPDDR